MVPLKLLKFYAASPSYVSSQNMDHGTPKILFEFISLTFQKDTSGLGVDFPEGGADHQNLAWFES